MEDDSNKIIYERRAKNITYQNEKIDIKAETRFSKLQKKHFQETQDIHKSLSPLFIGTDDSEYCKFGSGLIQSDLIIWKKFPNEDYFGHVSLENRRLVWISAMNYKITYQDPVSINDQPQIEDYDEHEQKLKEKSYNQFTFPKVIEIDQSLTEHKYKAIIQKYNNRIINRINSETKNIILLNAKIKRSSVYGNIKNQQEKTTNNSKLSYNQIQSIINNDYTITKAIELSKKIGVKYGTVLYYKHMQESGKQKLFNQFNKRKRKRKVIDDILADIDPIISELQPFNGPKQIKEVLDIRQPNCIMSLSWQKRQMIDNKQSYRRRSTIKSMSNTNESKYMRMNCAFKILDWMAHGYNVVQFDESSVDSNAKKRQSYTKTWQPNQIEKNQGNCKFNFFYSVSDISKLPVMASEHTTNAWTVLVQIRAVLEQIKDQTNVNLSQEMIIADDLNSHVTKMFIRVVTIEQKAHLLILPPGSTCLMASEYINNIQKNELMTRIKQTKSSFQKEAINCLKTIPRKYELSSLRIAQNNLLLSLDQENLY